MNRKFSVSEKDISIEISLIDENLQFKLDDRRYSSCSLIFSKKYTNEEAAINAFNSIVNLKFLKSIRDELVSMWSGVKDSSSCCKKSISGYSYNFISGLLMELQNNFILSIAQNRRVVILGIDSRPRWFNRCYMFDDLRLSIMPDKHIDQISYSITEYNTIIRIPSVESEITFDSKKKTAIVFESVEAATNFISDLSEAVKRVNADAKTHQTTI